MTTTITQYSAEFDKAKFDFSKFDVLGWKTETEETLSYSELFKKELKKNLSDTSTINEIITFTKAGKVLTISESIESTDLTEKNTNKYAEEIISLDESFSRTFNISRIFEDSAEMLGTLNIFKQNNTYTLSVDESLTLEDNLIKNTNIFIEDNIENSDIITLPFSRTYTIGIDDSINLSELFNKNINNFIEDSVSLEDNLEIYRQNLSFSINPKDEIGNSETLTKDIYIKFKDTNTFIESFRKKHDIRVIETVNLIDDLDVGAVIIRESITLNETFNYIHIQESLKRLKVLIDIT